MDCKQLQKLKKKLQEEQRHFTQLLEEFKETGKVPEELKDTQKRLEELKQEALPFLQERFGGLKLEFGERIPGFDDEIRASHTLPNGDILVMGNSGETRIFDPNT